VAVVPDLASAEDRKVVIDAGAAIKLQRLERMGGHLFTTGGVLREIRDEKARALLRTLPQEIQVKEPLPQDIIFTKHFAKLTGDLGFLSSNDLDLIALTVRLHREDGGAPLRERPAVLAQGAADEAMSNFWAPPKASPSTGSSAVPASESTPIASSDAAAPAAATEEATPESGQKKDSCCAHDSEPSVPAADEEGWTAGTARIRKPMAQAKGSLDGDGDAAAAAAAVAAALAAEDDEDEDDAPKADDEESERGDEDEEDGDSAGEWVTSDNIRSFNVGCRLANNVRVSCATSDYSVQNVLLQMGIPPLTFEGYAVRTVKLWGLVCRACFHFSRDTEKVFCPKCGNDTVVRVPIVVGEDGQPTVQNSGRKLRTKGMIFSMPKPQGGRTWKPIMAEDEIYIGGRDKALRHAKNQSEKERAARDPFNQDNMEGAWFKRPAPGGSRGGGGGGPRMQAGYGHRTNPNANNFKGFKGNKKK
jgi:RNA-binding protein NOB1